jgi:hypothetical protein
MNALPLETLTLLGSSIIGTLSKFIGLMVEGRRQEKLLQLQALSARGRLIDQARRYSAPHFQWTRRAIALIAVFFIIAFPKLVAVFAPDLQVVIGYTELQKGFLFLGDPSVKTIWQTTRGLVITPLDTHLLAAIIGLYFGGSLAQH